MAVNCKAKRYQGEPLLILQSPRFTEIVTGGTQFESSSFVPVEVSKLKFRCTDGLTWILINRTRRHIIGGLGARTALVAPLK